MKNTMTVHEHLEVEVRVALRPVVCVVLPLHRLWC